MFAKTDPLKERKSMWGFDLHGWENLMIGMLFAAGLFAVLVGVSTFAVVKLQRAELVASKDEFERYKLEAEEKVSRANATGEAAKADAAKADARAAEAQLALEKFKAPREFSPEGIMRVVAKTKPFSGTPFSLSVNPNPEPTRFMEHIAAALTEAGWVGVEWKKSSGLVVSRPGKPNAGISTGFVGLALEIDSSKASEWRLPLVALATALREEGFELKANIATDGSSDPESVHIFVGAKQ